MTQKLSLRRLLRKDDRRKLLIALLFLLAVILLTKGMFALLHSTDSSTNRFKSTNLGNIVLLEPTWDSTGHDMAMTAEPGMVIPKDPYAVNDSQLNMYIRLKFTVKLGEFDDSDKTEKYKEEFNADTDERDQRRLRGILSAIMQEEGTAFVSAETSAAQTEDWTVLSLNPAFAADPQNYGEADDELVYYFYYIADTGNMAVTAPGAATPELFDHLVMPVYKKEWLGVFDQPYSITVAAEGLPVGSEDAMTVEQAIAAFTAAA
ncbi:MAG: hypothetical protein IKS42_00040 [Oscillospiraceae bacterium]|nr:hypothetical protein [Oscillospiraceae bacterium]